MWFYTLVSSLSFIYIFKLFGFKTIADIWTSNSFKPVNVVNKNNFNYVFYKKNCIKSFICYWITYITSIDVLHNSKGVNNDLYNFIVPTDVKNNVISFNVNFNESAIEKILNTATKFVMWYNKNNSSEEYNTMIDNLLKTHKNFIVCDFNDTSIYKNLLKYYNYTQKINLIEFLEFIKESDECVKYLFPKNYRLSHLSTFNNFNKYQQTCRYLAFAKNLYCNKYYKIKKLTSKMYVKTIPKNYFTKKIEDISCNYNVGFINNGFYKSEIADYILKTNQGSDSNPQGILKNKKLDVVIVWSYVILNNIPTYYSTIRTNLNVDINNIINSGIFIEGSGYNGVGGAISSQARWNELNNFNNYVL